MMVWKRFLNDGTKTVLKGFHNDGTKKVSQW